MAAVVVSKINLFNPCVDRRDGRIFNLSPSSSSCNGGGERGNRILELKPLALMRSSSIRKLYDRSMRVSGTEVVLRTANSRAANAKMSLCVGKAQRWWEKKVQANMEEVTSAQHLVDSLSNAGEKLVILDFFSPGCGGCKALHPKICQLAEMNPDLQFLQVNYEEHKSMCYSLNVHVLPFFRFYRGAQGRLCSFSCTNATIKKFKDALARYSPDRCSLGPAKGLDEKEMLALASNRDLSFIYTPNPREPILAHEKSVAEASKYDLNSPFPLHVPPKTGITRQDSGERSLVTAGG